MFNFVKNISEKFFIFFIFGSLILTVIVGILWKKSDRNLIGRTLGESNSASPIIKPHISQAVLLTDEETAKIPVVSENDHVLGTNNAPVTVIVYSDYECPFCAQYHKTIRKVIDEFRDKTRLFYRPYPLKSIHPDSVVGAEAAECAADIGGNDTFWKYADLIFEDQKRLSDLSGVAESLEINTNSFQKCIDDKKYKDKVDTFYNEAVQAGVKGTPTSFIFSSKGKVWKTVGAFSYEDMQTLIKNALEN